MPYIYLSDMAMVVHSTPSIRLLHLQDHARAVFAHPAVRLCSCVSPMVNLNPDLTVIFDITCLRLLATLAGKSVRLIVKLLTE